MDLERSGKVWEYRPASHKTEHYGRERIIFIGPRAQKVLLPYLLRAADAYCFSPAESVAKRNDELRAHARRGCSPPTEPAEGPPVHDPSTRYGKDAYRRAVACGVALANREIDEEAAREVIEPRRLPAGTPTSCGTRGQRDSPAIRPGGRPDGFGPRQGRRNPGVRRAGLCPCGWRHGANRVA